MIERDRGNHVMLPISFTIPLPPVTKKNSQRILTGRNGKPYIAPSARFTEYARQAAWFIPRGLHINFPVNVKCLFYMPDRRVCDLANHEESIDDILVECGVVADDRYTIVAGHDGSRVLVDRERPRTEVTITILED